MKLTLIAVGVAALGAGGWFWYSSSGTPAVAAVGGGELFAVKRADLRITVTENGTMVAKESQKVAPKIQGEGKITWLVEEGKDVKEGEELAKLDPKSTQNEVEQLQLSILETEAQLKTARTELEIQQVEIVANVAKAKVGLERARKELEKYRDGESPQKRKDLEVAIKDAETDFNRAKKNLEDSQKLLEQNYIKRSELEDNQIAYDRAVVKREGALLDLQIFDKFTHPMQMTDLETKVADAERELDNAGKRGESTVGQKQVSVQQAEKRLKKQQDQLKDRQEELENMTLKAPCPGIVVYGDPHEPWYRERVKIGGQVWNGQTLMTIPDLRVLQVKIQVHEADIDKIKEHLPVNITMDTYPGLVLAAEVTKIATVAGGENYWGGSSRVKQFDVEITITGGMGDKPLRPGISAKAEIVVETRPQVLFVPLQCVFAEEGEQFCYVMTPAEGPVRRKVETGPSNDSFVEVANGLSEGDRVLLYNPMLPTGGETPDAGGKEGGKEGKDKAAGDQAQAGTGSGEGKEKKS